MGGQVVAEGNPHPETSPLWTECRLNLNGVNVIWPARNRTITVVNGTGGSYANLKFFVRRNSGCGYDQLVDAGARVGYAGIADGVTRMQGSGTTPAGTPSPRRTGRDRTRAAGCRGGRTTRPTGG
ncbi:hypothetical protein CGZ93_00030 [Enemella dayhoffiae]|uniref:Uncharacterized protein n=1 Tax=Enemella dayhoffiae TaxID=2016507 RepID=A0A255HC30_9ACTN|nr:hypothetical protein [Enemella dayhoffiae]OYO24912.1 hypothetical protein CGZ93_00030 [Enemella dayhoffiae]